MGKTVSFSTRPSPKHHSVEFGMEAFMSLITTAGKYCYIQCDRRNCNRKMEHVDLNLLKDLAKLCGWKKDGNGWNCPDCVERTQRAKKAKPRAKPLRRTLET
jgi:hypothetical protein